MKEPITLAEAKANLDRALAEFAAAQAQCEQSVHELALELLSRMPPRVN